ncbi:MAG: CoB--CoM heterodisulfide reductase iron-sulfur subunit B family protein [Candidatus Helarchaeota archaeon]
MTDMKLFSGCVIQNRLPHLEQASRAVFNKLGIEVSDAPFTCCPDPVGFNSFSNETWLALGANNLIFAEEEGKEIVSLCNGCTQTLKAVNHELKHDEYKKKKVNDTLKKVNKEFKGTTKVKHFVQVLIEDVGIEKIKAAVTKPLTGLKVACHTGCHYARPHEIMEWDDPFEPKFLREIVSALGATVIDYKEEWVCCGNGASNTDKEIGNLVTKRKIDSAENASAECFAVVCPACFQQLDGQKRLPVLYLTQLMALAMGIATSKELNVKYHQTKPMKLLAKLEL